MLIEHLLHGLAVLLVEQIVQSIERLGTGLRDMSRHVLDLLFDGGAFLDQRVLLAGLRL